MSQRVKDILVDDFWIMPATPEYKDDGIPYITSKNIKNGIIDFTKVNYISQEAYNSISRNRPILVGDILISMIGTLGETAEVKESYGSFYGQNMFLVRINENKVNKRYFLDFFKSSSVKRALEGKQNQSTQKYLKANHIEDLTIPMLKLDEQKLIAEQLDKLSYIIKLRTDELKKLDELIKARFVEMFGDKGYPVLKWKDVFNTTTGKLDSNAAVEDGEYPFFTCSKEALRIDKFAYDQEALLLAGNNAAGKYDVKYYKGKFNAYQRTYILDLKESWSYQLFRYQLEDKLAYLQQQSLGGLTKYLTMKILGKLEFIVPPIDKQMEFEQFVYQVDKSKVAVQKALDETKLLFDSLMQKYFG